MYVTQLWGTDESRLTKLALEYRLRGYRGIGKYLTERGG
jgi:hypothetical protein